MNLADLRHHIALATAEPNLADRAGTLRMLETEVMVFQFCALPKIQRNGIPIHLRGPLAKWSKKRALIKAAVAEVIKLWAIKHPGETLIYELRCEPQSWE